MRQDETLATLSRNAFNKIRMLVFPKYYVHSTETPPMWPYEGSPHAWNFDRPVYAFFQNYDRRVRQLRDLGIEADVILLNPYDGWGLKNIKNNRTQEERFLKYLIARLSAYRNVWWSMSNEYELWDTNDAYWDRVFQVVRDHDPYGHLRSIHNMHQVYDHSKPWVTHASLQQVGIHMGETRTYRTRYNKPIVWDEVGYEGNIPESWGRLTPQEMTRRFWIGLVDGAYVGHGETYAHPQEIIWWSKGGLLYGQSPARIAFLAQLVRDHVPGQKLEPLGGNNDAAHLDTRCYVFYYDTATATSRSFSMTAGIPYRVYVVDTWNMTKTDAGVRTGSFTVNLPNNPYMAVLLVQDGEPVPPPPPDPNFVKGINFHGSAVTIENNPWSSNAQALASGLSYPAPPNVWTSQIAPVPAVDPDTSAMLNTGIWAQLRNLSFAQTLADGSYDVFFWVLENHQSNFRAFDIRLEGTTVATSVGTMAKGAWRKYGPYRAAVADGDLDVDLIYRFGDPCLMGMAIFRAGATTSPPPTVTVAASDANASEAGTDAGTFTITRSGATTAALAVNVTIGGTASGGSDYASIGASVTLPAGSATAVVRVVPVDDTAVEGAETVALAVAPGAGYAVGTPSSAVVTIADNDASGGGGGG
ncbi:MAG TPA: DUF5605 domain-containing protein, partial [Planctomycetota bacterium]|nr:DUF5605 domain-containing protein [Planctomycetota bacterium]